MWIYKESYWYKRRHQCLCGSTKNPHGINRDSMVYVVLHRIILVQMKAPVSIWFYKESYWYKWRLPCLCFDKVSPWDKERLHGLCGSTKIHTDANEGSSVYASYKESNGTNGGPGVYVFLQRITMV